MSEFGLKFFFTMENLFADTSKFFNPTLKTKKNIIKYFFDFFINLINPLFFIIKNIIYIATSYQNKYFSLFKIKAPIWTKNTLSLTNPNFLI